MSGKRIVALETLCEHGRFPGFPHCPEHRECGFDPPEVCEKWCPGGTRRTLTEGQYVLIEKTNGSWPYVLSDEVHRFLDALSDHTEGTA